MIPFTRAMQALEFQKYEGLGNDFVLVEAGREDVVTAGLVRAVCDRRFGVGADGLLLVLPPVTAGAAARMRVYNADGSVPEMCGNGLRCVALHLARGRGQRAGELTVDTDAGALACLVDDKEEKGLVTVDMGVVRVTGAARVEIDGEAWDLVLADAGNPHAVTTRDATREVIDRVGPRIATHRDFSSGTNVEFARFGAGEVELVVWERGVGVTLACGTGACATVAVGVAKGLVPAGQEVHVRLPGGVLEVTVQASGRAIMRGPARRVFSGSIAREELAPR